MVHGCFPEDFLPPKPLICVRCMIQARRLNVSYPGVVLHYHGVAVGEPVSEDRSVIFSTDKIENFVDDVVGKIKRLNKLRERMSRNHK